VSAAPFRKAYIDTDVAGGTIQTHYRTAGQGMPLVVLHPSPMSSAFMVPVIDTVSDRCRVLAPDTPGYGATDPLPEPGEDLTPYVNWLRAFVDAQGLDDFLLYGSATGAQIAIEFAHIFPGRLRHLVLDNAVHFTDAERADIMARYFPDIAPRDDGSHLAETWAMAKGLFRSFPWYEEPETALPEPPLAVVQATALAYLVAGEDYARAYKAAFNNERAERVQSLSVPTTVLRWAGSLLRQQADRLDDFDWPPHITMRHSDAGVEARFATLRSVIAELVGAEPGQAANPETPAIGR
jgi:pimeloyl-ACP methyl ester carboxylesterase